MRGKADELYTFDARFGGLVAGTDEVGRGCLAGDVYAAAVLLGPKAVPIGGLDDSKKISPANRVRIAAEIETCALAWAVASASVEEIEKINILRAAQLAMRRAVEGLGVKPEILLVDGPYAEGFPCESFAVVGGDRKSAAIAAASILAKVTRDRYMGEMAAVYPGYGFERNMGYGSAAHRAALLERGPCAIHRTLFLRKILGGKTGPTE